MRGHPGDKHFIRPSLRLALLRAREKSFLKVYLVVYQARQGLAL